jgi:hypothetical protein
MAETVCLVQLGHHECNFIPVTAPDIVSVPARTVMLSYCPLVMEVLLVTSRS